MSRSQTPVATSALVAHASKDAKTNEDGRIAVLRKRPLFRFRVDEKSNVFVALTDVAGESLIGTLQALPNGKFQVVRDNVPVHSGGVEKAQETRRDAIYYATRNLANLATTAQIDPTERAQAATLKTKLDESQKREALALAQANVTRAILLGQNPNPVDVSLVGSQFVDELRKLRNGK